MAKLESITIFPIKSFDGVSVNEAKLLASGALEYDRRWAFIDDAENFINGKREPKILALRTEIDVFNRLIRIRHEESLEWNSFEIGSKKLNDWLAAVLG